MRQGKSELAMQDYILAEVPIKILNNTGSYIEYCEVQNTGGPWVPWFQIHYLVLGGSCKLPTENQLYAWYVWNARSSKGAQ